MKHDTAGDPIHGLKWSRKTTEKMHRGKTPLDLGSGLFLEHFESEVDEASQLLWEIFKAFEFAW